MTIDRTTYEQALAQLTGPGSPFELSTGEVRGVAMRNFALRPRSLRELVERAAQHGDAEFLVQGEQRLTYAQFARRVWGTAAELRGQGLRHGDRIAILAYNSVDYVVTVFACASVGAIVVALNGWWTQDELDYALRDSGSRMLIVEDRLLARVRDLIGKPGTLEKVFVTGASAPPPGLLAGGELIRESDEMPRDPIDEDDPFVILYTSGTTGRPKGCITTHRGTITQVMGILLHGMVSTLLGEPSPLPTDGSRPTSLMTAPLFHVAGIHTGVSTAMSAGAKVVLSEGRFDPEQVLRLIEKERVSTWSAIPTMLHRVVQSPRLRDYDLSSLVRISFGGAPTAPETMMRARQVFHIAPSLTNGYGMTETHGIIMLAGGGDLEENPTSVGRPVAFFDVKLVDSAGREVADGELGEVLLRGPTVTPGYWNRPEATAEAIRDGWLHTGDIAFRDANGLYTLVDRIKDMIIRGGENVYCVEIENCLMEHPDIDEAAIVGVPDVELGEIVKAVVQPRPGATLGAEQVRAHVAARLAAFKVPDIVAFCDEPLPRNAAGKIVKSQLRAG
ncbi:MAG: AMP-binding protein [Deltaproteobacteria bacterium]|nr:AMP-binding protein [Deltaproteobacteria bacterium]